MLTERIISNRKCYIYESGTASTFLLQAVDSHDLRTLQTEVQIINNLVCGKPFALAAFLVDDWNSDLSPWSAPAVFGNNNFGSGAAKTLSFVTDYLIPEINNIFLVEKPKKYFIGGYSLAGLFSLWAAYQTDIFSGVAALSPSVWFPDWISYVNSHAIKTQKVYLSLGDKEEKTKNTVLAAVGDNIRRQHELLSSSENVKSCILEYNPGNHFFEPEKRTAKGFAWLLK